MKEKIICGIQQVGIGVANVQETWQWYIQTFGMDLKIFADEGTASLMLPYTGGKPQPRYAVLAYNLRGGGGFEIWEPRGRELNYIPQPARWGDLGLFACKMKCPDVDVAHARFCAQGVDVLNAPMAGPDGARHFFVRDPWNNLFDIEEDQYVLSPEKSVTGGVNGVTIGVSDMDRSVHFYSTLLDYDTVVYDRTGTFEDCKVLEGGTGKVRRVLLKRAKPLQGPMSELMGTTHLELVQPFDFTPVSIYKGRLWGDPGFIHLCFDIRNMACVRAECEAMGHPFVCDSSQGFDMGDANGHFTYVEDPDGTLIEFVETFKIPVLKKWGLYLHLDKKDDKKPLPRFIVKMLRFLRVKQA